MLKLKGKNIIKINMLKLMKVTECQELILTYEIRIYSRAWDIEVRVSYFVYLNILSQTQIETLKMFQGVIT